VPITYRPIVVKDLPLLAEWLARPHVARWWPEGSDLTEVTSTYGPVVDGSDPTEAFIACRDGVPIGFLQRYRLDDNPDWRSTVSVGMGRTPAAGIDYLIGEASMTGRGIGRRMITGFVEESWSRYPDVSAVVVAVQQDNQASWRALEGAGFRRTWSGVLDSEDPSDRGPSHLYVIDRPLPSGPDPA